MIISYASYFKMYVFVLYDLNFKNVLLFLNCISIVNITRPAGADIVFIPHIAEHSSVSIAYQISKRAFLNDREEMGRKIKESFPNGKKGDSSALQTVS